MGLFTPSGTSTHPIHPLIDADNHHMARNDPAYRLIATEQVRPCFFSGDIEEPGKVLPISLNPAYTPKVTNIVPTV